MKIYANVSSEWEDGESLHIEIKNEYKELLYSIVVEKGIGLYRGSVHDGTLLFYEGVKDKKHVHDWDNYGKCVDCGKWNYSESGD